MHPGVLTRSRLPLPALRLKTWAPGRRGPRHDDVPPDTGSPVWFGTLVHLGGTLLSIPILAAAGMTTLNTLVVMLSLIHI